MLDLSLFSINFVLCDYLKKRPLDGRAQQFAIFNVQLTLLQRKTAITNE